MSAELEVRQRKKTKRKAKPLSRERREISVRYHYDTYKRIRTPLVGTFKALWPKFKDKYLFYCADVLPEMLEDGNGNYHVSGMQLSERHLSRYGNHKAWLDYNVRVNDKSVILVFNAE